MIEKKVAIIGLKDELIINGPIKSVKLRKMEDFNLHFIDVEFLILL